MHFKWTSSNKFLIKFLISLLVIGIIVGIIAYCRETSVTKTGIVNELKTLKDIIANTKQNNFIYHLLLICALSFLSIVILGLPVVLFYFFYEGLSFGFLLAGLFHYKKLEGLFFGIIFGLVNKIVLFAILIYLLIVSFRYSQKMIISLKNKDYHLYDHMGSHLLKLVFIITVVLIYDLLLYFFANKILAYFLFLL